MFERWAYSSFFFFFSCDVWQPALRACGEWKVLYDGSDIQRAKYSNIFMKHNDILYMRQMKNHFV